MREGTVLLLECRPAVVSMLRGLLAAGGVTETVVHEALDERRLREDAPDRAAVLVHLNFLAPNMGLGINAAKVVRAAAGGRVPVLPYSGNPLAMDQARRFGCNDRVLHFERLERRAADHLIPRLLSLAIAERDAALGWTDGSRTAWIDELTVSDELRLDAFVARLEESLIGAGLEWFRSPGLAAARLGFPAERSLRNRMEKFRIACPRREDAGLSSDARDWRCELAREGRAACGILIFAPGGAARAEISEAGTARGHRVLMADHVAGLAEKAIKGRVGVAFVRLDGGNADGAAAAWLLSGVLPDLPIVLFCNQGSFACWNAAARLGLVHRVIPWQILREILPRIVERLCGLASERCLAADEIDACRYPVLPTVPWVEPALDLRALLDGVHDDIARRRREQQGGSLRSAADSLGVPEATLRRRLRNRTPPSTPSAPPG